MTPLATAPFLCAPVAENEESDKELARIWPGTVSRSYRAAVVRIATGSATVATITGAGIVAPLIQNNTTVNRELLVLATGSGSLILSHVNDAGFWLVKEYFGLSVVETFKYWTTMETLLSILGLAGVLLASLIT